MNFRFSSETVAILSQLEESLHVSKTTVVEEAVRYYAKKKFSAKPTLLQFAGKISDKDANSMLKAIRSSRKNKNKEIKL